MATLQIGSLSEGTLKTEHLMESLIYEMRQIHEQTDDPTLGTLIAEYEKDFEPYEEFDGTDLEQLEHLFEESIEALQYAYVPDYCYLGMNESDGASFGVWISWESIQDGVHDGSIYQGQDVDRDSIDPKKHAYILDTNDHGNATLYGRSVVLTPDGIVAKYNEVWAVV